VVLPYIAGGMGVSDDEASWVVTTYLGRQRRQPDREPVSRQAGSAARPSS